MIQQVLGVRIKLRRTELGMTQSDLAELLKTNQKQISRYENGKQLPSAEVLTHLALDLDTTTDYLLGLTGVSDRPLRSEGDLNDEELELIVLYRSKPPGERSKILNIAKVV
jgi:transcriptional regulator with XRE-family HTH domain